MRRSNLAWACVIVGILALSLATMGAKKGEADLYQHYGELCEIVEEIKKQYVDDVSVDDLFKGAIKGMLETLPDPYNTYITDEDLENFRVETEGKFGGLGIEITLIKQMLTVITPIVGTPAFRAGVEADDRIIKIDDKSTEKMSLMDAVRKLRGKPGTEVTITVLRRTEPKPVDITIERAVIVVPSLRGARMLDDDNKIGYVWLTNFQQNTGSELEKALHGLLDQGMKSLVLDLRRNPGGLLSVAIEVSDLFIDEGTIVKTKGRDGRDAKEYRAKPNQDKALTTIPVACLVDRTSASASEIVAGALRDHKRAILVGTRTFGKGSVQTVIPMKDNQAALKLTTARYYTPNDTPILREKGITPDVKVELAIEQYRKLAKFIREEHIRENANGELKRTEGAVKPEEKPKGTLDKVLEGKGAEEKKELTREDVDPQLVRAMDLLRCRPIYSAWLSKGDPTDK